MKNAWYEKDRSVFKEKQTSGYFIRTTGIDFPFFAAVILLRCLACSLISNGTSNGYYTKNKEKPGKQNHSNSFGPDTFSFLAALVWIPWREDDTAGILAEHLATGGGQRVTHTHLTTYSALLNHHHEAVICGCVAQCLDMESSALASKKHKVWPTAVSISA